MHNPYMSYNPYGYVNPNPYVPVHPYGYHPHYRMPSYQSGPLDNGVNFADYGGRPFVINIEDVTENNNTFRTVIWTGKHLQVTLMSIPPGEDIGLERHAKVDQFLRIEDGHGLVQMGPSQNELSFARPVHEDDAVMVPAGTWHNIINTGPNPLKLYSIYAPSDHPFGTVHQTKEEAMASEGYEQSVPRMN